MSYYDDWVAPYMIDCEELIEQTHQAYENRHIGWTTKDWELIPYHKMSNSHLINCRNMILKNNWRKQFLPYLETEMKKRGIL